MSVECVGTLACRSRRDSCVLQGDDAPAPHSSFDHRGDYTEARRQLLTLLVDSAAKFDNNMDDS